MASETALNIAISCELGSGTSHAAHANAQVAVLRYTPERDELDVTGLGALLGRKKSTEKAEAARHNGWVADPQDNEADIGVTAARRGPTMEERLIPTVTFGKQLI